MKLFNNKDKEQGLTRTEALACIPQKSPSVTWEILENGEIIVEYPLDIKPFFLQIAARFQKKQEKKLTKKIQLDNLGSIVWEIVDGKRDVKSIIKQFAADTGISLHEAEVSITAFFRDLGRRGLILMH
jgi:hypothetical protein